MTNSNAEMEEIWAVMAEESQENLARVETALLALEADPTATSEVAAMFRALHTVKGTAHMMGLPATETLAHAAENLVALVRDGGVPLDDDMVERLLETLDRLRVLLAHILAHRADVDESQVQELVARLETMRAEKSQVPSPKPQTASSKTQGPRPKAKSQSPKTQAASPKPQVPSPKVQGPSQPSEIENLQPEIQSQKSLAPSPQSLAPIIPINPATEPGYVRIFLEISTQECDRLHCALRQLAAGDEAALGEIRTSAEVVHLAAERMGYKKLEAVLDDLLAAANDTSLAPAARLAQLETCATAARAEMDTIQQAAVVILADQPPRPPEPPAPAHPVAAPGVPATPPPTVEPPAPSAPVLTDQGRDTLAELTEMLGEMVADQATLHRIVRRLSESLPAETAQQIETDTLESWAQDVHTLGQTEIKMGAVLERLQEKARALNLRPAADMLTPFQALVETLANRLGKTAQLELRGADLELDRRSLETLSAPLQRLAAFCVAHDLETPDERLATGKSAVGHLTLTVSQREDGVQLTLESDGHGLNRDAILRRARRLSLTDRDTATADEMYGWLLRPEFGPLGDDPETRLDLAAVHAALRARQGRLTLADEPGQGLRFTLRLPLDLTVVDGMVVRVGNVRYIVPVQAIQRIVMPDEKMLVQASAEGTGRLLKLEGSVLPICSLAAGAPQARLMVIVENETRRVAVEVDELIGRQSVLVRPLPGQLSDVQNASGCALLGEGEVGMLLNLEAVGLDTR